MEEVEDLGGVEECFVEHTASPSPLTPPPCLPHPLHHYTSTPTYTHHTTLPLHPLPASPCSVEVWRRPQASLYPGCRYCPSYTFPNRYPPTISGGSICTWEVQACLPTSAPSPPAPAAALCPTLPSTHFSYTLPSHCSLSSLTACTTTACSPHTCPLYHHLHLFSWHTRLLLSSLPHFPHPHPTLHTHTCCALLPLLTALPATTSPHAFPHLTHLFCALSHLPLGGVVAAVGGVVRCLELGVHLRCLLRIPYWDGTLFCLLPAPYPPTRNIARSSRLSGAHALSAHCYHPTPIPTLASPPIFCTAARAHPTLLLT